MMLQLPAIKRLLLEEWDPIKVRGLAPNDEYDSYAVRVFQMLNDNKGEADVAAYLRWVAIENMGLSDAGDVALIARRIFGQCEEKP